MHMAKRGRSAGFHMGPEHRLKIKNSNVLNALIEHVEGTRDMSSTQVTAGVALLKKVMPDLTETMLKGDEESPLNFTGILLAPLEMIEVDETEH